MQGENGPQTLDDLIFPEPFDGTTLDLEGTQIDIVNSTQLNDRRYLWVEDLQAVFGGVYVFEGLHVWTADSTALSAAMKTRFPGPGLEDGLEIGAKVAMGEMTWG